MPEDQVIGDPFPTDCELIEVHTTELRQLFNPIDPSPLPERDLESKAEDFIVSWARSARGDAKLALEIHVDRRDTGDRPDLAGQAIREYFRQRSLPIRAEQKLYDRLSRMPVRIAYSPRP